MTFLFLFFYYFCNRIIKHKTHETEQFYPDTKKNQQSPAVFSKYMGTAKHLLWRHLVYSSTK